MLSKVLSSYALFEDDVLETLGLPGASSFPSSLLFVLSVLFSLKSPIAEVGLSMSRRLPELVAKTFANGCIVAEDTGSASISKLISPERGLISRN